MSRRLSRRLNNATGQCPVVCPSHVYDNGTVARGVSTSRCPVICPESFTEFYLDVYAYSEVPLKLQLKCLILGVYTCFYLVRNWHNEAFQDIEEEGLEWRYRVRIGDNGAVHFTAYPEMYNHAHSLLVYFSLSMGTVHCNYFFCCSICG